MMSLPAASSERTSQALPGEAATLLSRRDGWAEIRLERDGYTGWVVETALFERAERPLREYLSASKTLVTAEIAQAFAGPDRREPAGKLPFGTCLPSNETRGDLIAVDLPDGRLWWVLASDTIATSEQPRADSEGIAKALVLMKRSIGVPYLWGGCSPFGYDCSGFTQAFWAILGVRIPRDADQQFQVGEPNSGPPAAGDLLFFSLSDGSGGDRRRHASIRHVAIALGAHEILHASGRARRVVVDTLGPGGGAYGRWLAENLAGIRRYPCA